MIHIIEQKRVSPQVDPDVTVCSVSSDEDIYQNPADVILTHANKKSHLARRNVADYGDDLLQHLEESSWTQGHAEILRCFEQPEQAQQDLGDSFSIDSNLRSLTFEMETPNCPLYNYFGNKTPVLTGKITSPRSQPTPNANNESYVGLLSPLTTIRTPSGSLEKELLHMVESAWKSTAPKRDIVCPKKGKQVFLKILTTQLVSGTIIGRGGKGFNWFRRKSKIDDILLSMPWELYPKTDLRTMFLEGTTAAIIKATCIIADLMVCKYAAQNAATVSQTDKMLVMAVLPLFAKSAMERIRDASDPDMLSISLFQSSTERKEIVAVIKGVKHKVKALVGAISNSVAETVDIKDYRHVSYPEQEAYASKMLPSERLAQRKAVRKLVDAFEKAELMAKSLENEQESYVGLTDSQTEEISASELNETIHTLDDIVDPTNTQRNLAASTVVSGNNPNIKSYPISLNFKIPATKTGDAISIARTSRCFFTTKSADDPNMIDFSLSGPFEETVAVASLIVSVI
ncbi:uncharacterized protein BXIN_1430 [Babesia sp. Xinjiang]|uniref:uncharacterized protein n=1 Tax=Babesia sp. Xinjiang TaxID=462227 RepID=UPI000A215A17|nr:uncharacterized protein BXIN_1430 [Babesia sp. Xinjiang]ORM39932.1 hypothetical protein BXIN_1430 [Babesia sp. Xinjiang]